MEQVFFGLLGIFLGVLVVLGVEVAVGNPFIWLEEKIKKFRDR